METRQLKAFIYLAEELNFSNAASRFGISQPPFTRLIRQLEEYLNVRLFNRSTRHVELTGEGVYLLKNARTILQNIEQLESSIKNLGHQRKNKLLISISPAAIHSSLPRMISSFKEQFPRIEVEMKEHSSSIALKKLEMGELDVVFGANELIGEKIDNFEIQSYELGVLASLDNPLTKKKRIDFAQLEGQTLIFHGKKDHLGFQREFHDFLKRESIHVKIYYKKEGESCSNLAVVGKGLLITSKVFVTHQKNAVFIPFSDYHSRLKLYTSWKKDNRSLALSAFLSFIEAGTSTPHSNLDNHLA